ncbi:DotD/TraH family lipoprotein [Pseudoxanthomonas sp. LjRoot168]|uniref:DotD/TraH family lipoprotein n=1 Tax=unclassified Pseudoxanthomonas TaxID=2645906 RepID=UPI003ECC6089
MKALLLCGLIGLMAGCATTKPTGPAPVDSTTQAIERSATDISQSLVRLAEVEQYDRLRQMPDQPKAYTQVPDMLQMVSIPWDGPIEAAVRKLAKEAGYTPKILGRAPVIPVLVRIGTEPASVSDHLRNVGYQAGSRADVVVYPAKKVVELSYNDVGL